MVEHGSAPAVDRSSGEGRGVERAVDRAAPLHGDEPAGGDHAAAALADHPWFAAHQIPASPAWAGTRAAPRRRGREMDVDRVPGAATPDLLDGLGDRDRRPLDMVGSSAMRPALAALVRALCPRGTNPLRVGGASLANALHSLVPVKGLEPPTPSLRILPSARWTVVDPARLR